MILAGRITVNRMPAEVGQKVGPGDEVRINGEIVRVRFAEPRPRMLMYHKPAGELVTRDDPEGRPTVFEKLPSIGSGRWVNIGRLDYNTEGLLLFTTSGELANRMTHPRYEVEREYAVRVMGRLTDEQVQALTTGIQLDDGPARCEGVSDGGGDDDGSNHWYHVVLKEGRNREVRRLFEALGLMVSRLIRTRFGTVAMPTHLKRGHIAELEAADISAIVSTAGLRAPSAAPSPRQDPRGERPAKGKGKAPRPHGGRPGSKPQSHPHPNARGARGSFVDAQPVPADAGGTPGNERVPANPAGPRRSGQPHPKGARPWKQRGAPGKPAATGGTRPPQDNSRRRPAKQAPQGPRPPRQGHNFDEVQPQSNANASPFGRSTLSVPDGAPRGYGNDGGVRHRSGPRAHKAGNANGQRRGPASAGAYDDRRAPDQRTYIKPAPKPVAVTHIRSKRTRSVVLADVAADALANAAGAPKRTPVDDDKS